MNPAQIEALDRRLRGQDVIPNRNEVADFVTILADENATLRAERDELTAAIDSIETSNGFTSNGNLWRFWVEKAREQAKANTALRASEAVLATQLAERDAELARVRHNLQMRDVAFDMVNTAWDQTLIERNDAQARIATLTEALTFYAEGHSKNPNEGPWGMASTDFGTIARAALTTDKEPKT